MPGLRGGLAQRRRARGLAAFNDPARGNCARCHPSAMREGAFPQFTDFGFAALGAPRNRPFPRMRIPAITTSGSVRSAAHGPRGTRRILRIVSHADSAQRRAQARVSAQRRLPYAGGRGALLRGARYGSREMVSAGRERSAVKFDDLPRSTATTSTQSLPSAGTRVSRPR
jgi:hypothetical protein